MTVLRACALVCLVPVLYLAWLGASHVWADHRSNHITMQNQQQLMDWAIKVDAALRKSGALK